MGSLLINSFNDYLSNPESVAQARSIIPIRHLETGTYNGALSKTTTTANLSDD
jgi:hypothetical protein